MKKALIGCLFIAVSAPAREKPVVYGQDNRIDTFQSSSELFKKIADSTAAMIAKDSITIRGTSAEITAQSLGDRFGLCSKERFFHQPSAANCSGFLVASDIMATAGHCVQDMEACGKSSWVFNYKVEDENQSAVSVSTTEVYGCQSIVQRALNSKLDFALIKLDRPVIGHVPVKLSLEIPTVGIPLVVIGHPSGLPQKIADEARIASVHPQGFMANLDTFGINSGSAVFNAKSGEVVGILVSGDTDYVTSRQLACKQVNAVSNDGGKEGVSAVSQFASFIPR